tara:strand:- start:336 stop:632 length:297 start_codon:yes stop_codon:yes gene_type:complete
MNYDNIPLLRQEIQNITREIIRLCGKRQKKITCLGDLKKLHGVDIRNYAVESYLRTIVIQESKRAGLNVNHGVKILDMLIDLSLDVQRVKSSQSNFPK